MYTIRSQKGMTIVEILIVVAIIALIGVFAAVAVNAARSKQRDAVRLSNVRLVQSALEDYFNESNQYPFGELAPLGDPTLSACLGTGGFAGDCSAADGTFLRRVPPTLVDGLEGIVACGQPARNAFCYTQLEDGASYVIHFELENPVELVGLREGLNCATENGMEAGNCAR